MSFIKEIKKEICSQKVYNKNLAISRLSGLIRTGSEIRLSKKLSVLIITDILEMYNHINNILQVIFNANAEIELSDEKSIKNTDKYEIILPNNCTNEILSNCKIVDFENDEIMFINYIDESIVSDTTLIKEYIKGVFLGCATSSIVLDKIDNNSGYHLEFVFNSKIVADSFCELLSYLNIFVRLFERKQTYVVYLKSFEAICDLLTIVGATNSVLTLQNENVLREVKNNINRQNNCMTGNINKTIVASMKQINAINILSNTIGLENLPESLQEIAYLRLANSEESLDELITLTNGKYSKSSLNRRFQKLLKMAEEFN